MRLFKKTAGLAVLMLVLPAVLLFAEGRISAAEENRVYGEGFSECFEYGDWLYYDRGDHIRICGYRGIEESITLPSEIDGKRVTEVSDREHETNNSVKREKSTFFDPLNTVTKKVVVSEGIRLIGEGTFSGSIIEKAVLPESLEEIEAFAFYECKNLSLAEIPKNVRIIGEKAFYSAGLEEIILKEGLEIIGSCAFSLNPLKAVSIPSTVAEIGEWAFSSTEIEDIILPKNLTKVDKCVFSNCEKLKRACISEGTERIKDSVFSGCRSLEEVYFPSTLTGISPIFWENDSLKSLHFASEESRCEFLTDGSIWDSLFSYRNKIEGEKEKAYLVFEGLNITYNTPVPEPPPPVHESGFSLDGAAAAFMAITALGFLCTLIFLCLLIKSKRTAAGKKAEETKEEGFHPQVLGIWHCERCGTANGPVANYCYSCGKKRSGESGKPPQDACQKGGGLK